MSTFSGKGQKLIMKQNKQVVFVGTFYILVGLIALYALFLLYGSISSVLFSLGLISWNTWPNFLGGEWFAMTGLAFFFLFVSKYLFVGGPPWQARVARGMTTILLLGAIGLFVAGLSSNLLLLREGGAAWSGMFAICLALLFYRTKMASFRFLLGEQR